MMALENKRLSHCKTRALIVLMLAALTAIFALFTPTSTAHAADSTTSKAKLSATSLQTNAKKSNKQVNILFVGNSVTKSTRNYGVPATLEKLAKANGKNLHAEWIRFPGARLSHYAVPAINYGLRYNTLNDKLSGQKWDYIVLQEGSREMVVNPASTYSALVKLKKRINKTQPQAKILLFMTHGYENGSKIKINGSKQPIELSTFAAYVQASCTSIGERLGLTVVPVGTYYYMWTKTIPNGRWS